MAAEQEGEGQQAGPSNIGLIGKIEEQYRKTKEHAQAFPYVWGSYLVVYGGFGLWLTYRWRRLRNTEDRVRVLQERLRKIVEADESTTSAGSVTMLPSSKPPSSADKSL